jgi:hypothetical protein
MPSRAAEDGETVLAVILSSALSGTFGSAEAAAKRFDGRARPARRFAGRVPDARAARAESGRSWRSSAEPPVAIAAAAAPDPAQSGISSRSRRFDNLLASGRVGRGQVMIAGLLDIRPILGLSDDGRVVPVTKVRGRGNVMQRMLAQVLAAVPRTARALRLRRRSPRSRPSRSSAGPAACTVERAGRCSPKWRPYTSFMARNRSCPTRNTVVFTTVDSDAPRPAQDGGEVAHDLLRLRGDIVAAHQLHALRIQRDLTGRVDQPFATMPWLYGPMAAGAASVCTLLSCAMSSSPPSRQALILADAGR